MSRIRISVITIGHMPLELNLDKIRKWSSGIFLLEDEISNYALNIDSDGEDWQYSDQLLETVVPDKGDNDFLIAILNVPLQHNYYSRRLNHERVVFTFHEVKEFLFASNIPLENMLYRALYAYSFLYKRNGNRIPSSSEPTNFTHDETKGCIFDMNAAKWDIVSSLDEPIICSNCVSNLRNERVSEQMLRKAQKEIKKINKTLFYRIMSFIKIHPIVSIIISAISAIILGAVGSILGSFIYSHCLMY